MGKVFWYTLASLAMVLGVLIAIVEILKACVMTVQTAQMFLERKIPNDRKTDDSTE